MIKVEIANQQSKHAIDCELLQDTVRAVLLGESLEAANISVAVVDDDTIHQLNCKYLEHDYATDVLSFRLSDPGDTLEGEIVVSADTAARQARNYRCSAIDELLLYLVHGALHLVGYDDATDADRAAMRAKERHYLAALGREPIDESRAKPAANTATPSGNAEREAKP